jgi:hypothetical protein
MEDGMLRIMIIFGMFMVISVFTSTVSAEAFDLSITTYEKANISVTADGTIIEPLEVIGGGMDDGRWVPQISLYSISTDYRIHSESRYWVRVYDLTNIKPTDQMLAIVFMPDDDGARIDEVYLQPMEELVIP